MNHNIRPRAHIRHANRALGHGFPPFSFPTIDQPTPTAAGTDTSSASSTGLSLGFSIPIDTPIGSSSSSSILSSSILTSSSTTPTPSSTSTTTSSIPVSTTYTGSALHNNLTKVVTQTNIATANEAAASPSNTAVSTSSALVAPVLGGVAGGIVGLAALIFLVTFCLRRRRKDEEAINFDPGVFRRSAMLLQDPPTHQDTVARGYNPQPSMVETHPSYITQPNYDLSPGPGMTPTSGNPLVFEAPFSPISPGMATSPVVHYASPVLTRNVSASSSNATHGPAQYAQYPALPGSRTSGQAGQLAPEYVDMERTSVTPFQAAQYVEISKRLNTEVPKGLDTPAVEEFVTNMPMTPAKDTELPPIPQDPFADDEHQEATLPTVQDLAFPAPPSPVATSTSRYRIDSMPPSLPEIIVQSRVSVGYSENGETPSASPFMAGFPSGQTVVLKGESPMSGRFPVTPSPLASSFTVATPPASRTTFPERAATKMRPDTVYDPEDAYGGI
ncbi:hypothetical protein C8F01DRAFT_736408 [Mycena amicta]|nr:hypothetical protein C8F01DRAFT_736408 [Mycena amicta]